MANEQPIKENKYDFALNESNHLDVPVENNYQSNASQNYQSKNIHDIRNHYGSRQKGDKNYASRGQGNYTSKYASNRSQIEREIELKNYKEQYNSMYDPNKLEKPMFDLTRFTKDEKIILEKTGKGRDEELNGPNMSEAVRYRDKCCDWAVYTLLIIVSIWF